MVLSDSEQEFSLWQTQPEIQQLAAIIAAVKGKGRKKGGRANGGAVGARNSTIKRGIHEGVKAGKISQDSFMFS